MQSSEIARIIETFLVEMKLHEKTYVGFPNNMLYSYERVSKACSIYINNCGDPFSSQSWKKHSKSFELEVIEFFLQLYELAFKDGWGYVTSGGTEGNMEGMLLAREAFPKAMCYFSQDSHYSIEKIARILRMDYTIVNSRENGEIDGGHLNLLLKQNRNKEAILVLNCGTTTKGAFDNLSEMQEILAQNKIENKYIHIDAALSGMITPYVENAPFYSFKKGIDSIAISLHKFLGVPLISGIVLAQRKYIYANSKKIEYINSHDATISGSRNGHSALFTWYMINKIGSKQFKKDANSCIENANYLHKKLLALGIKSNLNLYSNTVYFPKPSSVVVDRWQLSCSGKIAHVVVMPHVSKELIDQFLAEMMSRETTSSFDRTQPFAASLG